MRLTPIAALTLLAAVARAQDIEVPYRSFTLPNGLQVIVHEDHSDPVACVYLYYHVGSAREEAGKSGFAHLFEHMLFQGSEHVADDMHFKYVTEAGGTLNGSTNTDRTNYFESLPANQLELALWLESDRMGYLLPALTQAKLENQIDVVKNERRQNYENRPYGQADGAIMAALYPKDHPYSWLTIGSHEDLSRASLEDVKKFFARWYGPNNATLAIGGDVDFDTVRTLVERYFGPIPRGPAVDRPAARPVTLTESKYLVLEDKVKLPQVVYTWPTVPRGADDQAALDMLDSVLAADKSSILTKALTIDEQLASQVQASSECNELAGTFTITLRAQPGVTLDVLQDKLNALLVKLAADGVSKEQVERVITRGESALVRQLETASARTSRLANDNVLYGRPDAYKETLRRRRATTPADVERVLKQYVLGKPAIVMSVVPEGKQDAAVHAKPLAVEASAPVAALDRTKKPAAGPLPAFHSPTLWHDRAGNGLELAGIAWRELPLSTLSITVPAGRRCETMTTLGLSSLTAAMLQQGTTSLSAVDFTEELDRLGADINVSANDDEIVFRLTCLDEQMPAAAKLLADVILHPRFAAEDFERLKKDRLTSIDTRSDQIRLVASDVYNRLIYGDASVIGRSSLGTKATVGPLELEDVKSYWQEHIVPGGSRLAYVGSLDAAALKQRLAPLLGEWKGAGRPIPDAPTARMFDATRIYLVDKPGAAQSEIRIGHAGVSSKDADYYALTVVNWPLGGSFSSRINLNLREDKGYTYGARSGFEGGLKNGPFTASGAVKTDVTAESVSEFMKELNAIRGGVTAEELAFTKDSFSQSARRKYESTRELVGLVEAAGKFGWQDDFPARELQQLDTITVERAKSLAGQWIHPDRMAILVVGDKSKIYDKLQKLGYGEPIVLDYDGNPSP